MADYYGDFKPGYPNEIIDATISKAELRAGSRILEIGCGSGKVRIYRNNENRGLL